MTASSGEVWESGDKYEPYVGRWSRLVARDFLAWLAAPLGLEWLDVGCGTGALAQTIAETQAPAQLAGVDQSEGFLRLARRRVPEAAFYQSDAQKLPFLDASFDRVVSGLVLNFLVDRPRAVSEMARVVRSGGEVALYVWDYAGRMELMRCFWDAVVALNPAIRNLDEGIRFPGCRPEALAGLFHSASLQNVQTRPIDVPTLFRNFDDYWAPFLGGQGPAPAYCASLPEDARTNLRERIKAALPISPDGSINLTARAWAVRGRKD
jgi:SAM-dependent methyltransferase